MVINYSKWDAIELSDDSDIEVHPNVDKRSFIRAKQAQIHQERDHRKHQIATLKYERIINDGLLRRINNLLTALKSHKTSERSADELVFQSLMESAGDPAEDKPPAPPADVHKNVGEQPAYSKMMASLIDQVKKEVDQASGDNRLEAYLTEIDKHKVKVDDLQAELHKKLAELETEEKRHITSEHLTEGFNYSKVATAEPGPASSKSTEPELLNPGALKGDPLARTDAGLSSGAEADVEDATGDDVDDDSVEASPIAKEFAKIPMTDYRASHDFISKNTQILKEKETDGLLVEAFNSELEGKTKHARQCVHQALLLQYCRSLGRDGVALFFKRVTTQGHQAQKLFTDDVRDTYGRIHTRAAEIKKEREANPEPEAGVEQIQLHAVDPNTQINIAVPPADSEDPEIVKSRQLFETFPPGLRRALESGKLDEVNKVLGKMSVEEAEEVVGQLGEGGMLSVEEGVIDATTEEGRKTVEEIEKNRKMPGMADEETLEAAPPS
ncbi:Hsp90 co-chaperone Cdc37 [Pseudovirgaria hyperparasitica]|uniref:Hsp90 chaperone protein kinase-targeting subunit n=1 Tax=Pseudovirgaria hyperparasitica TaxID=470096 RepID=A0A6A6WAL2_9PEZI|nr:Hsp90 co-chaperone Cdc37 [Pseudovirgaria hyperparasitica]KAF2758990.1 Hsp90 co-chaperone Cdc37 [Pseudovirgaria hyperparasitica]